MKTIEPQRVFIDGKIFAIGYKVMTEELCSLGLRNNPSIIQYQPGLWHVEKQPVYGIADNGGMWCARTLGSAHAYQKYMLRKHEKNTRVFMATLGEILFINDGRVKTDRLFLHQEI